MFWLLKKKRIEYKTNFIYLFYVLEKRSIRTNDTSSHMIRLIFFDLDIYIRTLLVDHKTTKSLDSCLERWIELKLYNDVTQNYKSLFYMMFEEDLNDWISRVVQGRKVCMCKGQLSCHHIQNKREKGKRPVYITLSSIIINANYWTMDFLFIFLVVLQ
jgi:hypothetical protein